MTIHWKDQSSFSRSDVKRTPTNWVASVGKLRVNIHRHVHYPETTWLVTCAPFFDKKPLKNELIGDAKQEALDLVFDEVKEVVDVIQPVLA